MDLVQGNPRGSNRSGTDKHRSMNRGSKNDMDGSTFRSGRFNHANKTNGAPPPRGAIPRADTATTATSELSAQRQKLQLKPKTQHNDNTTPTTTTNAYSDIFGAGKKQDVGEWEQRHQKDKKQHLENTEPKRPSEKTEPKRPSDTHSNDNVANINDKANGKPIDRVVDRGDHRHPGREREGRGGGRGRSERIGNGARGRNPSNNSSRGGREGRTSGRGGAKDAKNPDAPKLVTKAFIPAIKPVEDEKKPKVINKFAALAFGEDSDSD